MYEQNVSKFVISGTDSKILVKTKKKIATY